MVSALYLKSMKRSMPNQTTSTLRYKDLIVFLVCFLGEESGLLQLVLQGVHALLIGQRPVLEDLAGTTHRIQLEYKLPLKELQFNESRVTQVRRHAKGTSSRHARNT